MKWTVLIGLVPAGLAAGFAYTAGWFSPQRLGPDKFLTALAPPGGPAAGHRRNHSKGICFTGVFTGNRAGAGLSRASVLALGAHPVVGRFSLATAELSAADTTARVRGMAVQITGAGGQVWRSANITAPFFPMPTPAAFYDLLTSSGSKEPGAMAAFAQRHPEIAKFGAWANSAPWTGSFAEDRFNGLDAFLFTDASGTTRAVRWSFVPKATPVTIAPDEFAKRPPNTLEQEIQARVSKEKPAWSLLITVAEPGDQTANPAEAWPEGRRTVDVGTMTIDKIEAEADGPCRSINFDPTVLPDGMQVSDDPFPAARSSVYAASYDRRTAEAGAYPREAKP